ncbi:regulator of G protein signaling superfamily, partial [Polyplosphaeria fusca]
PSLSEILANSAPPPWTLSSFMAHLSQNHCLENLEFTLDASWYKKHYFKMMNRISGEPANPPSDERAYVLMLWRRLIALYVQPNGAREINLPSDTRDALVDLSASEILPYPSVLDSAVTTVHKLMEESILPSFL